MSLFISLAENYCSPANIALYRRFESAMDELAYEAFQNELDEVLSLEAFDDIASFFVRLVTKHVSIILEETGVTFLESTPLETLVETLEMFTSMVNVSSADAARYLGYYEFEDSIDKILCGMYNDSYGKDSLAYRSMIDDIEERVSDAVYKVLSVRAKEADMMVEDEDTIVAMVEEDLRRKKMVESVLAMYPETADSAITNIITSTATFSDSPAFVNVKLVGDYVFRPLESNDVKTTSLNIILTILMSSNNVNYIYNAYVKDFEHLIDNQHVGEVAREVARIVDVITVYKK